MEKLNFKSYKLKIKNKENKLYVFDEIRKKKYLVNTRGMGKTKLCKISN